MYNATYVSKIIGVGVYNFLVLGFIPGTNIQITFQTWVDAFGLVLFAYCGFRLYQRYRFSGFELMPIRQPLHASQLHQRLRQTVR